jgi:AcrR family transcriptional regulator
MRDLDVDCYPLWAAAFQTRNEHKAGGGERVPMTGLQRILPDPFSELPGGYNWPAGATAASLDRQRRRRASMLACSRRVLARESYEHFTVRRVADECAVTAQTVYNCFGSRNELVASTLNEFTAMMYASARASSTTPTFFLELAYKYCLMAEHVPAFTRAMMVAAFSSRQPLLITMRRHGAELRKAWVRETAQDGCFEDGVDAAAIGNQICCIKSSLLFEWAVGDRNQASVSAELLSAVKALLRPALRAQFRDELDFWHAEPKSAPRP